MQNLDFIAIGDTVVDDFIRLKDAKTHCRIDNEDCELCVRFGDKVPFETSTIIYGVGNAANAAVSASRLGLSTGLITNIGKDTNGDKIVEYLKSEKLDTSYVTQQAAVPTNYHYVLWYENERTILVHQNEYEYHFPMDLMEPKIVYFSSIGEKALPYRDEMVTYLEAHPNIFFTFQPGVFDIKAGVERLARLYKRANLIVINKEEAQRILKLPDTADEIQPLLDGIHALGPKVVIVTDYLSGAYGLENGETVHLPMYKGRKPPVEPTGAGDAFASTTTAYYATGTPLKDAMLRGMANASEVVQDIGAQRGLQTKEALEQLIQVGA